jgi:ferric-dicitrate binding protein FerR (iron transport regulator)
VPAGVPTPDGVLFVVLPVDPQPIASNRTGTATMQNLLKRFCGTPKNSEKATTSARLSTSGRNGFSQLGVFAGAPAARAVVWSVTWAVPVPDAMFTDDGDTAQVELVGAPVQVSATV